MKLEKSSFKFKLFSVLIFLIAFLITGMYIKNKEEGVEQGYRPEEEVESKVAGKQTNEDTEEVVNANSLMSENEQSTKDRKSILSVGIVVDDYENRFGTISSLEEKLDTNFRTVSFYLQFGNEFSNKLSQKDLSFLRATNKRVLISWEPWNPSEGLNQSRDYLSEIIAGNEDNYIIQLSEEIKNYPGEIIIRFGHEMNGNWYPWGNRPEEYVSAYRHIVDIFRQEGVGNTSWMWSINSESVPPEPISSAVKYYPGDNYVDLIGIDGYNFGIGGVGWRSFSDIFSSPYNFLINNFSKPIIISEVASSEEGGNKSVWIENMFSDLNSKFSNISEIIWFNLLKESDWRIESTDSSLNSFRKKLSQL